MYNVGKAGYSWSSSVPAGSNAYGLNFNNTVLNPQGSHNRANGFQVRCLQAFIRDTLSSLRPDKTGSFDIPKFPNRALVSGVPSRSAADGRQRERINSAIHCATSPLTGGGA